MASPKSLEQAATAALAAELRIVIGRLIRRVRDQADVGDLTWSQISILKHLDQAGPATVTTLARAEGVRPQSIGATIAVLEQAGLVAGSPDPRDGRQTILSITPACRALIDTSRAAREDWLFNAIDTKFSREEQQHLLHAVDLLKRLLEPAAIK
jgi:DNA-binding MarR family transcriptional regulator